MAASIGAALIGAGSSIYSGNQAANAAENAAQATARQHRRAVRRARNDLSPYLQGGAGAANALMAFLPKPGQSLAEMVQSSPGYQFRLDQGQQQLDRFAGRAGNLFSGRALMGAQEYGQNFASNEFGNYINQLNQMAGSGQNAATNLGSLRMGAAGQIGAAYGNAANTRGSAYVNQGNALNSLINQYAYGQGYG